MVHNCIHIQKDVIKLRSLSSLNPQNTTKKDCEVACLLKKKPDTSMAQGATTEQKQTSAMARGATWSFGKSSRYRGRSYGGHVSKQSWPKEPRRIMAPGATCFNPMKKFPSY